MWIVNRRAMKFKNKEEDRESVGTKKWSLKSYSRTSRIQKHETFLHPVCNPIPTWDCEMLLVTGLPSVVPRGCGLQQHQPLPRHPCLCHLHLLQVGNFILHSKVLMNSLISRTHFDTCIFALLSVYICVYFLCKCLTKGSPLIVKQNIYFSILTKLIWRVLRKKSNAS